MTKLKKISKSRKLKKTNKSRKLKNLRKTKYSKFNKHLRYRTRRYKKGKKLRKSNKLNHEGGFMSYDKLKQNISGDKITDYISPVVNDLVKDSKYSNVDFSKYKKKYYTLGNGAIVKIQLKKNTIWLVRHFPSCANAKWALNRNNCDDSLRLDKGFKKIFELFIKYTIFDKTCSISDIKIFKEALMDTSTTLITSPLIRTMQTMAVFKYWSTPRWSESNKLNIVDYLTNPTHPIWNDISENQTFNINYKFREFSGGGGDPSNSLLTKPKWFTKNSCSLDKWADEIKCDPPITKDVFEKTKRGKNFLKEHTMTEIKKLLNKTNLNKTIIFSHGAMIRNIIEFIENNQSENNFTGVEIKIIFAGIPKFVGEKEPLNKTDLSYSVRKYISNCLDTNEKIYGLTPDIISEKNETYGYNN